MSEFDMVAQFHRDAAEAKQHWHVIADETVVALGFPRIRYVVAEARTGSRYGVLVTPLTTVGRMYEGGPLLVTVTAPWQDAWALQSTGELHASYVAEHLSGDRWLRDTLHGGDLAALTLTVAHALDREAVIDG